MPTKHLMTGPREKSEFCFTETLIVPQSDPQENIEVKGKNSLFLSGPIIKCLVIPPNSKTLRKNRVLDTSWLTNLPRFQEA